MPKAAQLVGRESRSLGRPQQTVIDTHAKVAFAKLYDRETPITDALYVIDGGRTATGGAITKGASRYSGMRSPNAAPAVGTPGGARAAS